MAVIASGSLEKWKLLCGCDWFLGFWLHSKWTTVTHARVVNLGSQATHGVQKLEHSEPITSVSPNTVPRRTWHQHLLTQWQQGVLSHQYLRDPDRIVTDKRFSGKRKSHKSLPLVTGSLPLSMVADSATRQYPWNTLESKTTDIQKAEITYR